MISRRLQLATGIGYHVLEWAGPPNAETTFVLVHGFSDLAAAWTDVAERLARHAHVIAPDLRGHGDSDWISGGGYYHFMDYVADLDDVIRQCARKRVILVGHSMGGSVAGYYAGTRPDRLHALALIEGLGPPDQSTIDAAVRTAHWIDAWAKARRDRKKTLASLEEAATRLRKNDPLLGEEHALVLARVGTVPVDDGFAWKHDPLHNTMGPYAYRVDTAMQFWKRVTCPVLAVDGAITQLNLPLDERARRRAAFANCRHVVIPDAGHAVARHQPAALASLLIELL
jgi:pimeloyl-ACP methyl ester carboxylesterase